jgi:hypothetical protein
MNRMLDAIFIVDMMLQFCVVYQQASERGDGDAKWVTERRKIVKNCEHPQANRTHAAPSALH